VGTCSAPFGYGDGPCGKNTDCEAALICNSDTERCDYNPTPAQTLTPTPVTPLTCPQGMVPQGNVCVKVSRSGGCSIGDPSARGTAAPVTSAAGTDTWLVALLPLALGIRRLRRQQTRAHAQRPIRIALR
jgi:hypothetical protein